MFKRKDCFVRVSVIVDFAMIDRSLSIAAGHQVSLSGNEFLN
jgi:hypothetical protein